MEGRAPHGVGDQFELLLFPGVPWQGRSPRSLTRVRTALFLRQEPPGHVVSRDPMQLEMWPVSGRPHGKKAPERRSGAPLLLDVKRTRRGRTFVQLLEDEHGE